MHDDESGQLTFFNNKGVPLHAVALRADQYVPSEKIKWNPAGTIAWMDQAANEHNRILDIDIDYLKIAPQEIHFFDPDGLPIASVQAEEGRDAAVEVAGWQDANIAVMKSYTLEPASTDYAAPQAKDVYYFLYDVKNNKKGSFSSESLPSNTTITVDRQEGDNGNKENIMVSRKEITYKARK